MTSWHGNAVCITWVDRWIHKGPVMRSFYVSFVVILSKLLNKQSNCRWVESPWRLCDIILRYQRRRQLLVSPLSVICIEARINMVDILLISARLHACKHAMVVNGGSKVDGKANRARGKEFSTIESRFTNRPLWYNSYLRSISLIILDCLNLNVDILSTQS